MCYSYTTQQLLLTIIHENSSVAILHPQNNYKMVLWVCINFIRFELTCMANVKFLKLFISNDIIIFMKLSDKLATHLSSHADLFLSS